MQMSEPLADYAIKHNLKRAILMTGDNAGSIESSDTFAAAFIKRGGAVVQETHPPFGNSDYGPYLAQMDSTADVLFTFLPGIAGLRFMQQYSNYSAAKKPQILDYLSVMMTGPNRPQLKDKLEGIVGSTYTNENSQSAAYKTFVQAWKAKYPDRLMDDSMASNWAGAQAIAAALQKVNGNVEDKQGFLNALYAIDLDTAKGPMKLDQYHDVIQNIYVVQAEKSGDSVAPKLLDTAPPVSQFGSFTKSQIEHLNSGKMNGKWVGMSQAQLQQLLGA